MEARRCEICGKSYKTYPILLCDNPICFASFLLNEIYEKELDFGRYSEDLNNLEILKKKDVMQFVSSK